MKRTALLLFLAASVAVSAQTAPTAPKASTGAKSSTAPKAATTSGKGAVSSAKASAGSATAAFPRTYKLPADEKRVLVPQKTVAVLTYQDLKAGTGPEAESQKMWHVKYKGWRAEDGVVFDSWENNKRPVMDKDGKPEMDADGKPKMEAQPLVFPQGMGRLIPGFDYGVTGMRVGGKRRLFIPWQMAYGTRSIPDRPDHPGIPAKSNLIFDVELVEVTDMPAPPQRPMIPPGGGSVHPQPVVPPRPGAPGAPATQPGANAPVTGQPTSPDVNKPATPAPSQSTPQPAQPQKPDQPSTPQQPK